VVNVHSRFIHFLLEQINASSGDTRMVSRPHGDSGNGGRTSHSSWHYWKQVTCSGRVCLSSVFPCLQTDRGQSFPSKGPLIAEAVWGSGHTQARARRQAVLVTRELRPVYHMGPKQPGLFQLLSSLFGEAAPVHTGS
jgi:hypothetical protein